MDVEHVARIRFASRRAAQQQGYLAIRDRVFGKVIVHDKRVLALIAEVFAKRRAGVGRDILQRGGIGGGGGYDNRIIQRTRLFQNVADVLNRCGFLADGDIDTDNIAALLVDNRVQRDSGFADATVADNQLALPSANRHKGVNGLQARLQRLLHRLAIYNTGRARFDIRILSGDNRTFAIQRIADSVDKAAKHGLAHRHFNDLAGASNRRAFLNLRV